MKRSLFMQICFATTLAISSSSAFAQIGNLGGGNAGGAAEGPGAAQPGSTTEGFGGQTTEGVGDAVSQEFTGGNFQDFFVGGGGDFFANAISTDRNGNRQFQALNSTSVPTGGTRNTSGNPRSVRTRLKVSFDVPTTRSTSRTISSTWPSMQRMSAYRSDLQGVRVSIDSQGVATLTGQVADDATRRLAANLMRLRPGVRRLDNQLVTGSKELIPVLPLQNN